MATELMRSPVGEVRWNQLLGKARPNKFEPTKKPTWEIELLLDKKDSEHMAWAEMISSKYEEFHPGEKKHTYWLPIKPDKEKPEELLTVRFKLFELTYKDGNKSEGPIVYDKDGHIWPADKEIGNYSKMRIGFDIYGWKGPTGSGLMLQPKGAQVLEWLAAPTKAATTAADFGFDVATPGEASNCGIPF